MKRKHLIETPVCPRERLVIISYTTGLSFALERIGPLAALITIVFYLLALYLFALPNTPENPFASIYSESLIIITCQHLLLLVGFDTLIYRKYYDTSPILVGHQYVAQNVSLVDYFLDWQLLNFLSCLNRQSLVEKGLPFASLVAKLYGPRLKGALVLVQLEMWAREH
jgi:hypothetical protein